MTSDPAGVRPTRRCLDNLGVVLPDLGTPLDEIDDPVIKSAQSVPEQRDAGGAERVTSLRDRVWFKVKAADLRAVATELRSNEIPDVVQTGVGGWWIGAAGHRQADSPQRDFYAKLTRECCAGKTVSTERLLPGDWDWKRLCAEQATKWRREMKKLVVRLIAMSLESGHVATANFRSHNIRALVRADNGHEAYLAIIADGVPDARIFALLLDCVPGVNADDWQCEPSPVAEMNPAPGEIIWSTLIPPEIASEILAMAEEARGL